MESDYRFKKGAYADNIRNFLKLYDEISVALKEDTELVNLFQSQLTDTCYPDPQLKTLTIDVGFTLADIILRKRLPLLRLQNGMVQIMTQVFLLMTG